VNSKTRVFISYSHDSPEHEARILELANRLYGEGVEVILDQYEEKPDEGWPLWTEKQILRSDFVLMVCTETYLRRVMKEEEPGKGLGVCWEAHIIMQLIYEDATRNQKYLPVLLRGGKLNNIPTTLRSFNHYLVDTQEGYDKLYRTLTGQPRVVRPKLGTVLKLPVAGSAPPDAGGPGDASEDDNPAERIRHSARYNSAIWELTKSRAQRLVEDYNQTNPNRFTRAVNLIPESYSLGYELSIIMLHPEERSFNLRFRFRDALMEYSYPKGVTADSGVLEVIYSDSRQLKFRHEGKVVPLDETLKKLLGPLFSA
jgi:hypothetical protein